MTTCLVEKLRPTIKIGQSRVCARRKNPVFHLSTFLRVPSGVMAITTPPSRSAMPATLSTMVLGSLRLVGIPPNHSKNQLTPGIKMVCLASQRILRLSANMEAMASTKSQFEVCGAPINKQRLTSGISPTRRHPESVKNALPVQRDSRPRLARNCTGT